MNINKKYGLIGDIYFHFKKNSIVEYILYILGLLLLLNIIYRFFFPSCEGFDSQKQMTIKRGNDIYDDHYVNTYDAVMYDKDQTDFEIKTIQNQTNLTDKSIVLDVGSGTGHHVKGFNNINIKAVGIDISPAMITKAKSLYPDQEYVNLDARNSASFPQDTFTHITCFNFTIYHLQDKNQFFENCYKWLKPGGYVIVNLVDKEQFDPVVSSSNPLNLSKYVEKGNHNTKVKLVDYDYKSNIEIYPNDATAVFRENIKDITTGDVRVNELRLFMPSQKEIINIAKSKGFIILTQVDMSNYSVNTQYLYIFQKPT